MTQKTAIVDKLLTDVSQKRSLGNLVFGKILTPKKVTQYTGKIGNYGASHLRLVNLVSGGENGYLRMNAQTRSSSTYQIETKGLEDVLTDEDYRNVELPYDAKVDSTDALTDLINLANEYSIASAMGNVAVVTNNVTLAGTDQWSDSDNSDPIGDITTGIIAMKNACGVPASKAVCSWEVYQKLRYHPVILDKLGFKYNKIGGASAEEVAAVFELKELIVADASYNTAKEGATPVYAPVWGKNFTLFHSEMSAAKRQTTLGYNVTLTGGDKKIQVTPNKAPIGSDTVMIEDKRDQIITDATCAYLIKNAIA